MAMLVHMYGPRTLSATGRGPGAQRGGADGRAADGEGLFGRAHRPRRLPGPSLRSLAGTMLALWQDWARNQPAAGLTDWQTDQRGHRRPAIYTGIRFEVVRLFGAVKEAASDGKRK